MKLNTLRPATGSKTTAKRRGRGIGSGLGKTGGRGHKGQKSRAGGYHKVGFEGGQMPIQRRLPKIGFRSRKSLTAAQLRLHELAKVDAEVIDLQALKDAGLIAKNIVQVKVFLSGELTRPVKLKGLAITKGARSAVEAAGGSVENL